MGKLLSIRLIELVVSCYDFVTLPIYSVIQKPWARELEAKQVHAEQVEPNVWQNVNPERDQNTVETLDQLFRHSVTTYANKECLGVRKVLALEYKDSPSASTNGANSAEKPDKQRSRPISKYVLDDKFTWITYKQAEETVVALSCGLVKLAGESLKLPDESRKLLICADTCKEWFLTAHACFRNNITLVTAYTALSDEAILHAVRQTEVRILVVSQKIAKRMSTILEQESLVDTLIVLDQPLPGEPDELENLRKKNLNEKLRLLSYDDLVAAGRGMKETVLGTPQKDDIAVIMYTSGSTGQAKGVMLTQNNIVFTALSFSGPDNITYLDRYLCYLPLGHVMELAAECIFLRNGCTIAYSSPATLLTMSPMIKKGQKGDAIIFQPTVIAGVPLVLDRVRRGLQSAIKGRGPFWDQLVNDFVISYKRYWWERFYETPILNKLVCKHFAFFGTSLRAICTGGAALSRETQEYLRHVSCYTVLQGYGLTETSAASTFTPLYDRRYNVVGPPYPKMLIKLESWSDYSVDDKPHPRGEIVVGGPSVAMGYHKMEEATKESFYTCPKTGMRFFRTGDVGLMLPDGSLRIIDRKKDIVKPLSGEYISLSEVEVAMKTSPVVENVCVYCSQYSNYVVALVKPDMKELRLFAKRFMMEGTEAGASFFKDLKSNNSTASSSSSSDEDAESKSQRLVDEASVEFLCSNKWLTEGVLKSLKECGSRQKLRPTHIPSRIKLVTEEWTPESNLITASLKIKRRDLERFYAEDIKGMYLQLGQNIEQH